MPKNFTISVVLATIQQDYLNTQPKDKEIFWYNFFFEKFQKTLKILVIFQNAFLLAKITFGLMTNFQKNSIKKISEKIIQELEKLN
ncbi:hypothetical protein BpHYR1_036532 [Brachionus plicatilis]|uniref:Uncharacterized protein n=1 Tax=Brachionus plicatilis TaxID=10195 RepID=A0A3M7QLQ3_BRAPC|nr:hypothetical protein BpHYR1_036532 [Brachionus plicatilis]